MTANQRSLQGSIQGRLLRGGTSKGLFVRQDELPPHSEERSLNDLVLELFGTPDPLQVDGIGGSHSHTSKLMIVAPSERSGIDLDYTFGQVGIEKPVVDWSGNCGNLTSAIGVFGLLDDLVEPSEPMTELTLYNTNTETRITQTIPVVATEPQVYGNYEISGVPGSGARIDSTFHDPAGSVFSSLFPTGNALDSVSVDGEQYDVSLVDVTNPCVFIRADDLGLEGTELPEDLSERTGLLERLERIRGAACTELGIVNDLDDARTENPTTPFIALVSQPQSYDCSIDERVQNDAINITARIVTTQTPHHAYAMTGAMCLAAATQLPETIPASVVNSPDPDERVTIGHPKGTISVGVTTSDERQLAVESVTVGRTARQIMTGEVYYRDLTTVQ